MVKSLDDQANPPLLNHIGWRLTQAARAWKRRFDAEMVRAGYPWFGDGPSSVIAHLSREGTPQADLAQRMGLTKQAVQQLVDGLAAHGIVERRPDPADKRSRIIAFTPRGLKLLSGANRVKRKIEADYQRRLGRKEMARLAESLEAIESHSQAR